jgi:hypothetical protein
MSRTLLRFAAIVALALVCRPLPATPFTQGNLAVLVTGSSQFTSSSINIYEIDPIQKTGKFNTVIASPFPPNMLLTNPSSERDGYLSLSNDRTLLSLTAYNVPFPVANANATGTRVVGTLNAAGNFTQQTTYVNQGGTDTFSATTLNNTNWFISDSVGVFTNNTGVTPSPASSTLRALKAFGGAVYAMRQSANASEPVISTLSAPSGGSLTGLPGLTNSSAARDFYLISSGSNGALYDVLYLTATTSILKYSLDPNTMNWMANGSSVQQETLRNIAAATNASGGADLYVVSATPNGQSFLSRIVDSAGWNQPIATGGLTGLFGPSASQQIRGLEFVPVPEPSTFALLAIGGMFLHRACRRQLN